MLSEYIADAFYRLVDWVSSHVVHKTKKAETWVTCLKDS